MSFLISFDRIDVTHTNIVEFLRKVKHCDDIWPSPPVHANLLQGEPNSYDTLQCLPCKEGCMVCTDDKPCILILNWVLRGGLLGSSCFVICFIPVIACFIWKYKEVHMLKAASPKLLYFILGGAFFLYCPVSQIFITAIFDSYIYSRKFNKVLRITILNL